VSSSEGSVARTPEHDGGAAWVVAPISCHRRDSLKRTELSKLLAALGSQGAAFFHHHHDAGIPSAPRH